MRMRATSQSVAYKHMFAHFQTDFSFMFETIYFAFPHCDAPKNLLILWADHMTRLRQLGRAKRHSETGNKKCARADWRTSYTGDRTGNCKGQSCRLQWVETVCYTDLLFKPISFSMCFSLSRGNQIRTKPKSLHALPVIDSIVAAAAAPEAMRDPLQAALSAPGPQSPTLRYIQIGPTLRYIQIGKQHSTHNKPQKLRALLLCTYRWRSLREHLRLGSSL